MKILVAILALLISTSAFSHEGFKDRDRYTDEHGVPYGGQNPPVYAGNTGAHCMYSVYGCSGAGGSTDPRGYAYPQQPYGYGYGYPAGGCGSTATTSGGAVAAGGGSVAAGVSIQQSRTVCTPNGVSHQSRGASIGVVNGAIGGSMNFGGTVITTP